MNTLSNPIKKLLFGYIRTFNMPTHYIFRQAMRNNFIFADKVRHAQTAYMSAHVLLNLSTEFGIKRYNARLAKHFISFSQRV